MAIAALVVGGRSVASAVPVAIAWIHGLGPWGPVVFIAGYVLGAVALVPGSVLALAGGALYGLVPGILVVSVSAVLGACAAFAVSRYVARRFIERHLGSSRRFRAIDRAVAAQGFTLVVLLRMSPIVPFGLLNYGLGLTGVRFRDYLLGSVGMLPILFLYVYYGKVAGEVATAAGGGRVPRDAMYWSVVVTGLVATAVATAVIGRVARQALDRRLDDVPDTAGMPD